jgi:hypothetical protein
MHYGTLPRFDCVVCGKSAYIPRLSVNADISDRQPSANDGLMQYSKDGGYIR